MLRVSEMQEITLKPRPPLTRTSPGRSLGNGTGQWRCSCDFVWESGETCGGCGEGSPSTVEGIRGRCLRREPKTHCRWGHALTSENTIPRRGQYNITPRCKKCDRKRKGRE